jgi:hypothetical protein
MIEPQAKPQAPQELGLEDLTQEIDAPLLERFGGADEPTLSRLDLDEIEVALDL